MTTDNMTTQQIVVKWVSINFMAIKMDDFDVINN